MGQRLRAVLALGAIATAAAHGGGGAASAHATNDPSHGAHHAVHYVVAVNGKHHHLFANRLGSRRMRNLGGHLYGAPGVAYAAGQVFFVAETLNGGLQIRTEKADWAPLVNRNFSCYDPEISARHGMLIVGCLRDNAAWVAQFPATSAGDPHVDAMVDQGGSLGAGPAVSFFGDRAQVEVLGGDYILGRNDHYNTYYRATDEPAGHYTQDPMYECAAPPTETSGPHQFGENYLGCVVGQPGNHHLAVVGISPDGEDSIQTNGHARVGRIGLAPTSEGSMYAAYTAPDGSTVVEMLRYLHQPNHRTVVYRGAHSGAAITAGPHGYR